MKKDSRQLLIPFSTSFVPVFPGIPRLPAYRNLCLHPAKVVFDYHKARHGHFSPSTMCRNGRYNSWQVAA